MDVQKEYDKLLDGQDRLLDGLRELERGHISITMFLERINNTVLVTAEATAVIKMNIDAERAVEAMRYDIVLEKYNNLSIAIKKIADDITAVETELAKLKSKML